MVDGAVILDENGVVVKDLSCYLGRATNNAAEYEGLLMGLEVLLRLGEKISSCKAIPSSWCAS
jgi:ribonuclease HI